MAMAVAAHGQPANAMADMTPDFSHPHRHQHRVCDVGNFGSELRMEYTIIGSK
jgi:hypothetical protein